MFEAAGFELRYDFGRFARHLLDHPAFDRREIERSAAQHDHRLLAVKPFAECQHDFEGLAPDNNDIDAAIEFFEAVRLLLASTQAIERVVRPS